jgi:uncharacterized membrane protein
MTEFIYSILVKIGYTHPLHPALVHFPIGMAMGALAFMIVLSWLKKTELAPAAYYSHIFGLITLLPTMIVGYMDWQHFYNGDPNPLIIAKIVLGFVLMALFSYAILLGRQGEINTRKFLVISMLCFVVTCLIGFFGGELQYGS